MMVQRNARAAAERQAQQEAKAEAAKAAAESKRNTILAGVGTVAALLITGIVH